VNDLIPKRVARLYIPGNTSPLTDYAAWWDGSLTIEGAANGTAIWLKVMDDIICSAIVEGGCVAFFENRPSIPLKLDLPLMIDIDNPEVRFVGMNNAEPLPKKDAYFIPVTISGSPTRHGTPYTHAIVSDCSTTFVLRPLTSTPRPECGR